MSGRLRIRLLLVIAACVVGAGVASATIQRSASNADFEEYAGVTAIRVGMLAQDAALQQALHERTAATVERFSDARHAFDIRIAKARARDEEADEEESLARQQQLADDWGARAERAVAELVEKRSDEQLDPARAQLLQAFLTENGKLLADLAKEREARQRHALQLPIGLIALLTLLSAVLLWIGVERPARGEGRRRGEQDELAGALQVARSEPEAYDVLARHLTRSTASTQVTILNRNNSADRLEPVTPVRPESAVAAGLERRPRLLPRDPHGRRPPRRPEQPGAAHLRRLR